MSVFPSFFNYDLIDDGIRMLRLGAEGEVLTTLWEQMAFWVIKVQSVTQNNEFKYGNLA